MIKDLPKYGELPSVAIVTGKPSHLRLDMLSQILTLGNIHAHSKVVVMETCQGLLTGAVLERLGGYNNNNYYYYYYYCYYYYCILGYGQLVQVFYGDKPVRYEEREREGGGVRGRNRISQLGMKRERGRNRSNSNTIKRACVYC